MTIDYIRIDSATLKLPGISDKAKMLLGLIKSFTGNGLMTNNAALGETLSCSPDYISKLLKEIATFIRIEHPQSRYRKIFYTGKNNGVDETYSVKTDGVKADSTPPYSPATPSVSTATPSYSPATPAKITDITKKNVKELNRTENVVARQLADLLMSLILEKLPSFREGQVERKEKTLQRWTADIDLMIRLDHRTPEVIGAVIRWAQADTFWQANILSARKLREKFDNLQAQMKRNNNGRTTDRQATANRQHIRQFAAAPDAITI